MNRLLPWRHVPALGGRPAPAAERNVRRGPWIPRTHMPRTHRLTGAMVPARPVRCSTAPPLLAVGPNGSPQKRPRGALPARRAPFRFRVTGLEAG